LFSRDRDISSNGFFVPFGGFDARSGNFPGRVGSRRLLPTMFYGAGGLPTPGVNTPIPGSSTGLANNPFYINPFVANPNAYPGAPGIIGPNALQAPFPQFGTDYKGGGDYFFFNFAAFTPALPPGDRQVYYGSFTRDICEKYLSVFADFKYARSYFDSSLAAVPFTPDPFKTPGTNAFFSPTGISVPLTNPFNPFTVADATLPGFFPPTPDNPTGSLPVTTGVRFRGINDTGPRSEKFTYWDQLFDVGLRGEMGEFADYLKTWNWELGFRYSRDELNSTFQSIGSVDGQSFRVNRDVWGIYEEIRVPFTSPTWNFPGFYSFEVDFAEREEWYSNNTSAVLASGLFPRVRASHSRYNAQKPKVSVRWQPLDPKYIGAVTLRGSYTEAFHAPTLGELTPASSQNFPIV